MVKNLEQPTDGAGSMLYPVIAIVNESIRFGRDRRRYFLHQSHADLTFATRLHFETR
jgi:hypothetical protein